MTSHVGEESPFPSLCLSSHNHRGPLCPHPHHPCLCHCEAHTARSCSQRGGHVTVIRFHVAFHPKASPSLCGAQCLCCGEGRSGDPRSHGPLCLEGECWIPGHRFWNKAWATAALSPTPTWPAGLPPVSGPWPGAPRAVTSQEVLGRWSYHGDLTVMGWLPAHMGTACRNVAGQNCGPRTQVGF